LARAYFPRLATDPLDPVDAPPMVFDKRQRLALDYDRFPGGIFNPALTEHAGAVWGLARCELHDQSERNADKSLNFLPQQAVLFRLDNSLEVTEAHYEVQFENFPELPWRAEDYRLFVFGNRLYCTHTLWVQGYNIGIGLSQVDLRRRKLTLINPVYLEGVPVQGVEKNWIMIPGDRSLHCLYSFYPDYVLTELTDLDTAQFQRVHQSTLPPPANGLADRMISLSCVPQPLNDALWLLVHQKDEAMIYHDYLVRLNGQTLQPEAISAAPVISGGDCEGFWRGFLTVFSLLFIGDQAVISFGEGDRFAALATAPAADFAGTPMQPLAPV